MKVRRLLASALCAAIIFSSEPFSMGVNAAANDNTEAITMSLEGTPSSSPEAEGVTQISESPSSQPDGNVITEGNDNSETATPSAEPEGTATPQIQEPTASITPGTQTTPEASAAPQASLMPEATQTPEAIPAETPSASPEGTQTPSGSPAGSASPEASLAPSVTPSGSPSASPEASASPELSPTPSASPEEEGMEELELNGISLRANNDILEVDEDGVLKLIEGASFTNSTVTIPAEAKTIPSDLFQGNGKVTTIKFEADSQLTTIEASAFKDSMVQTITDIPAGVTEIKDYTFKNSALKSISFKGDLISIGEEAFENTDITSFWATASLKTIGNSAFSGCQSLRTLGLTNVEEIGARAFQNCRALTDGGIGWSNRLLKIGDGAFQSCGFTSLNLTSLTEESLTFGVGVFTNCSSLTRVTLPKNLITISNKMFESCSALESVTMFDSVKTINPSAFGKCTSLKEIVISAGVNQIMENAFEGCSALVTITIKQTDTTSDSFLIADNAFPAKSGVTMKGYDGKVEEYAEKMGYTFESLNTRYSLWATESFKQYASLRANTVQAVAGTEMEITVKPKSGYLLKEGTLAASGNPLVEFTLTECTAESQTFTFLMPEADVLLDADFIAEADLKTGKLAYLLEKVNDIPVEVDYDKNEAVMTKTGREAQLNVFGEEAIGAWLLTFKSSNQSVATITDTGLICAKGKGTTTISATLRSDTSKSISFKLTVKEDAFISHIALSFSNLDRAKEKSVTVEENGVEKTYDVIEYNKATLEKEGKSFKVTVTATEEGENANLIVTSSWTAIDSSIAAPTSSKSTSNSNTIKVKKGVEGETMLTVSVTNKDDDKTVCSESFIVRVVDATPRLADSKITVNVNSKVGTEIDVVPVYGYAISEGDDLALCQKRTVNGIASYDTYEGLAVEQETDGTYRVVATDNLELASGKSKTFKGSSQLYLKGEFDNGGSFAIPVTELTVTNKSLNPTVKLTGKINLFYNSTASAEEQGSVKLTQSLTSETVEKYELVSAANYKKKDSESPDTFAYNFDIDADGVITRSAAHDDIMQVSGKNVTSGYVYIYYEGYNEPVKKKITVPTSNTAPSYVLSETSATASAFKSNQVYELQLLNKKTKEPISLEGLDGQNGLSFDYSASGTTEELFKDLNIAAAQTSGVIALQVDGEPFKGKAVINVKMATWSKPLKYTFNLKITSTMPKAKFSATTVTLNQLTSSQTAQIDVTLNQKDASLVGFEDLIYTGSSKYAADAEKLMNRITLGADSIRIGLPEDEIKAMTYSFKVRPVIQFEEGDDTVKLGYTTFKVTINSKVPTIKLKSSTFTLNAKYPGEETAGTTYTIGNLPVGSSYQIDGSEVKLTAVNTKSTAAVDMAENVLLSFNEDGTITVRLRETAYYKSFNYDFYVNNLKVKVGEAGEVVAINKFKIKVKGNLTTPSVKVTAKGTLNPVDETTSIVYTAKVSNIVSDINSIEVWELNLEDGLNSYYKDDSGQEYSKHFEIVRDTENPDKVILTAKEGVTLKSGTSYKIRLVYKLTAVDAVAKEKKQYKTGELTIKPKQTLPKLKTSRSSAYLYAGQNRDKTVDVTLTKTSLEGAEITGIDFASGTSDAIKRAYRIYWDEENSVMTLKLVNPAVITLGKKQTITFETKCKNQLENSKGTTFKLEVTVRK